MTIEQAIKKAIEGGLSESGGGERTIFLDPLFWQSLGKKMGWENYCPEGHGPVRQCTAHFSIPVPEGKKEYFCGLCGDEGGHVVPEEGWRHEWHRFIDHLADGGTPETYFEKLK